MAILRTKIDVDSNQYKENYEHYNKILRQYRETLEKIRIEEEELINCHTLTISPRSPKKNKNLSEITFVLSEDISYKEYIDKVKEYFEEKNLKTKLGLQGFEKKGSYIMGLKGGKEGMRAFLEKREPHW